MPCGPVGEEHAARAHLSSTTTSKLARTRRHACRPRGFQRPQKRHWPRRRAAPHRCRASRYEWRCRRENPGSGESLPVREFIAAPMPAASPPTAAASGRTATYTAPAASGACAVMIAPASCVVPSHARRHARRPALDQVDVADEASRSSASSAFRIILRRSHLDQLAFIHHAGCGRLPSSPLPGRG